MDIHLPRLQPWRRGGYGGRTGNVVPHPAGSGFVDGHELATGGTSNGNRASTASANVRRQTLLRPDERPVMKWNGNPFVVDGGDGGRSEDDGAFFLLPIGWADISEFRRTTESDESPWPVTQSIDFSIKIKEYLYPNVRSRGEHDLFAVGRIRHPGVRIPR